MPEFVVTQTSKEFGDYIKSQKRKALRHGLLVMAIGLASCGSIYYFLWNIAHP